VPGGDQWAFLYQKLLDGLTDIATLDPMVEDSVDGLERSAKSRVGGVIDLKEPILTSQGNSGLKSQTHEERESSSVLASSAHLPIHGFRRCCPRCDVARESKSQGGERKNSPPAGKG